METPIDLDVNALFNRSKINLDEKLQEPPVCYSIGNAIAATYGNYSIITGKPKAKKTYFISLIVSTLLLNDKASEAFINAPKNIKEIVFIDTEQSKYDVQKVALRMRGKSSHKHRLKVFTLRALNWRERYNLIVEIVNRTPPRSLIIIDGLRDLVTSVNNEEEATLISTLLLKASEEKEVHIVGVIHQNKNDKNARGHLGTELTNKAETVISVEVHNSKTSKVKAMYCRGLSFPEFHFSIDHNGSPYLENSLLPHSKGKSRRKRLPIDLDKKDHHKVLTRITENLSTQRPNYGEIIGLIEQSVSELIEEIGITKAKDYFNYYLSNGKIKHVGKKHTQNSYYKVVL